MRDGQIAGRSQGDRSQEAKSVRDGQTPGRLPGGGGHGVHGGVGEQAAFLRSIRFSRAAAFRKEIVPYFRYVFQSGFGLFISAIFFAALIWYTGLIKDVPEHWPAKTVGIAVLTLTAIIAPLRTYFRPADTVFLLAMENGLLRHYVRPALYAAIMSGAARTLAVFALYAPIYLRAPETASIAASHPVAVMAIAIVLTGGFNVYAGWRERRVSSPVWRMSLRVLRWLLTALATAAFLLKPLLWAAPLALLCAAVLWLLWKLPAGHALPWERLIEEEEAVRRRWVAFLGWFVDVPSETAKAYPRRWIAWIGDWVPWRQSASWKFLYAKTFLRSETFGALLRWVVIAAFVLVVSDNGLADAIAYAIAVLVAGMQLGELRRIRFVETADTLPIAPEGRLRAAASVARVAGLTAAIILGLAVVGTAGGSFRPEVLLPAIAAGLLWTGWLVPRKIAKHAADED